jgi:hypothetical protein
MLKKIVCAVDYYVAIKIYVHVIFTRVSEWLTRIESSSPSLSISLFAPAACY